MYGYFRCPKCNGCWESAHVYPKDDMRNQRKNKNEELDKEYWEQECKKCKIACQPYRVEPTICSKCGQIAKNCNCDKHSDPNKPHRSDLCLKCRAGRPCQFN